MIRTREKNTAVYQQLYDSIWSHLRYPSFSGLPDKLPVIRSVRGGTCDLSND